MCVQYVVIDNCRTEDGTNSFNCSHSRSGVCLFHTVSPLPHSHNVELNASFAATAAAAVGMRPSAAGLCQGLLGRDHYSLCCQDNLGHTSGLLSLWAVGMYHTLKLNLLSTVHTDA